MTVNPLDINVMALCGRLTVDPELREFDSGARVIRYLIAVGVETPRRRLDVIPVTFWDPPDDVVDSPGLGGERVHVCGSVQRRFWENPDGGTSRIEVVAAQVTLRPEEGLQPDRAE